MEKELFITSDGSHSLFIPDIDETYHSRHGAINESKYIFIDKGLNFYIHKSNKSLSNKKFHINVLEVGLGTGLNLLLTYLESLKLNNIHINYTAIEPYPLSISDIESLNYCNILSKEISISKNELAKLFKDIHKPDNIKQTLSNNFNLKKEFLKIEKYLQERKNHFFDIIYYDAFAPSKQPSMWHKDLIVKITSVMNKGGVLVTYCSRGEFRRMLGTQNMKVERLPGPIGKNHMTRAIKEV